MVQYISKHLKGASEMTSQNLKEMNLPSSHQKDMQSSVYVADMVEEPSEPHVSSVSNVKAAALSQAVTLRQIRMKVDMVKEPAEPQEIEGEMVSAIGELKNMRRGDEEMEGRDENNYDVNQQVSQPITTNITVMYSVDVKYKAVKNTEVEDMPRPLCLAKVTVKEEGAMYDDEKLEEVLAELGMQLESSRTRGPIHN